MRYEGKPFIFAVWHNRILPLAYGFRVTAPEVKMACLTSPSKDGAVIESFMKVSGIESIRGSSSRRGKEAMKEMIKAMDSGSSLTITPDGPRGPVYTFNSGAIRLAAKTGYALVLADVDYSDYREYKKSWDKFRIPMPFSRVKIHLRPPIIIPPSLTSDSEEELRKSIEQTLISSQKYHTDDAYEEYRW